MIYQRNFIKGFPHRRRYLLVVPRRWLVSTQAINLFGRAADGRVAIDAVSWP